MDGICSSSLNSDHLDKIINNEKTETSLPHSWRNFTYFGHRVSSSRNSASSEHIQRNQVVNFPIWSHEQLKSGVLDSNTSSDLKYRPYHSLPEFQNIQCH